MKKLSKFLLLASLLFSSLFTNVFAEEDPTIATATPRSADTLVSMYLFGSAARIRSNQSYFLLMSLLQFQKEEV